MFAFKYLMIFEGVGIEISHDDALKGFSFSRSDMLFNKFDQLLSFCGVIASLMSIDVNDFEFLVRQEKVYGNKASLMSVNPLDVF